MILTDSEILRNMELGSILVEPFRKSALGSNSYDVHLGDKIAIYKGQELDARRHNETELITMPKSGYVLQPDTLYLGVTEEYTETHQHVPFLEGKSSVGRLGIDIHATAGKGDIGFCNYWTLEISVKMPVKVYPGMPIGQLIYFSVDGEVLTPYATKKNAKYTVKSPLPMESQMFRNFSSEVDD